MKIAITQFGGIAPLVHPVNLADFAAQAQTAGDPHAAAFWTPAPVLAQWAVDAAAAPAAA